MGLGLRVVPKKHKYLDICFPYIGTVLILSAILDLVKAASEYLVHTISVQCLLLDHTTLDYVVRCVERLRTE